MCISLVRVQGGGPEIEFLGLRVGRALVTGSQLCLSPCKHRHTHNSAQRGRGGGTRTPGGPRPRSACAQQAFQLIDSAGKMFPSWAGRAVALLVRIPASGPPSPPSPPAPRSTPSDGRHSREPLSSSLDASSLPTEQNGKDALLCTGPLSTNNRFSKNKQRAQSLILLRDTCRLPENAR